MRNYLRALIGCCVAVFGTINIAAAEPSGNLSDTKQRFKLSEAYSLIAQKKPADAIELLNPLIVVQEAEQAADTRRHYCARSAAETMAYMLMAATDKVSAVANGEECSLSLYLKAFALIDLKKGDEAKVFLDRAITLSPLNSQFLGELGEWYKARRQWPEAIEAFKRAESAAGFSPAEMKVGHQTRAWRGLGFVLIEQGKLDQAETMFRKCLTVNPSDRIAQGELDYIKSLRPRVG